MNTKLIHERRRKQKHENTKENDRSSQAVVFNLLKYSTSEAF